ncbi:MAG: hypothetical protein AAB487_03530 [Patescibacteria group bacterium]
MKNEFVIDDKVERNLMTYYQAMLKLVEKDYPREFARANQHRHERSGINFSVFGKNVTQGEMLDGLIIFVSQKPQDYQQELRTCLYEKWNIKEIKHVLRTLEDFLRKLPGAKLPEPRPEAMEKLTKTDG